MSGICRYLLKNITRVCYSSQYTFDSVGNVNGVTGNSETLYKELKERFKLCLVEYPEDELLDELVETFFKPTDIPILTHCKVNLTEISELADRVGLSVEQAREMAEDMAERGVVNYLEFNGIDFVGVPDYIIGWYEFINIYFGQGEGRVEEFEEQTGMALEDVNDMMFKYLMMYLKHSYDPEVFSPLLRCVPFDLTKGEEQHVLTFESVKGIIRNADAICCTTCTCKFHETNGNEDELPEGLFYKCCIGLGPIAEFLVKMGKGELITSEKAVEMLEILRDTGHMFQADHPNEPATLCCCHKEYCGILKTYYETGLYPHESRPDCLQFRRKTGLNRRLRPNLVPVFNPETCVGCGKCVERCVMDILHLKKPAEEGNRKKLKSIVQIIDEDNICAGCLNCLEGCPTGSIDYIRVKNPIKWPQDVIEGTVYKALKRGTLNYLIFDDPLSTTHKIGRKIFGMIENTTMVRKLVKDDNRALKISGKIGDKAREMFYKEIGMDDYDD